MLALINFLWEIDAVFDIGTDIYWNSSAIYFKSRSKSHLHNLNRMDIMKYANNRSPINIKIKAINDLE